MNKYDYGYTIHQGTTTSFAFDAIANGSRVLEIGCSNGNLTKHLAEEKACRVDIVEIDAEAGAQAARFAAEAMIGPEEGDLEGCAWLERIGDRRYDYVVALDVIEHLRNPERALLRLKELLGKEGKIILSVPNMAHNSVLIDMIRNRLQYNELGILDNTHLRFFTQGTLDHMVRACGLRAIAKHAIQLPVGSNEIKNSYNDVSPEWQVLLKERPLAEVFQFIYVLCASGEEAALEAPALDTTKRLVKLYYKLSEKDCFDEEHIRFQYVAGDEVDVEFDLKETHAGVIRIVPMEDCCLLEGLRVCLIDEEGKRRGVPFRTNGVKIGKEGWCFSELLPEVVINVDNPTGLCGVSVCFQAALVGQTQLALIARDLELEHAEQRKQLAQMQTQWQQTFDGLRASQAQEEALLKRLTYEEELLSIVDDGTRAFDPQEADLGKRLGSLFSSKLYLLVCRAKRLQRRFRG